MKYTQQQKELLLDKLFDNVICLNIYIGVDIIHKNKFLSYYNPKTNMFWLNWDNIWKFFKNGDNYKKVKKLTEAILRDLTGQKELTTSSPKAMFINNFSRINKNK